MRTATGTRTGVVLFILFVGMVVGATPADATPFTRPTTTSEITVAPDGAPGTGAPEACSSAIACSAEVAVTPDGHYAAFSTVFSNLVPDDTNGVADVFVRDLWAGVTERVSVGLNGSESNGQSGGPSISDDGRYVAFESEATNLTTPDGPGIDSFVFDRTTGQTELVGLSPSGALPNGSGTAGPHISGDGRTVAFWSGGFADDTTNDPALFGGGINFGNVYIRDLIEDQTELVSRTHSGQRSTSVTTYRSVVDISADGRFVAFDSRRHDLVSDDNNTSVDVFVVDRDTGLIERVSVASDGTEGNWASYDPSISADGRYVAFFSFASNLVPTDTNQSGKTANVGGDVFVHDRQTGETERVSVSSAGEEGNLGGEDFPTISPDGRYVSFMSISGNLVEGGTDQELRLYLHDRQTGQTEPASIGPAGESISPYFASPSALSEGAGTVIFSGQNSTTPFAWALYARDRGGLVTARASTQPEGDGVRVSGTLGAVGIVVSTATDPMGDGGVAGTDIAGASLALRPELDDLYLEIETPDLIAARTNFDGGAYAGPFAAAGLPGTVHGVSFVADGTRYEVRATRADPASPSVSPTFSLYSCAVACSLAGQLKGGYGTTGDEITVRIPMSLMGDPAALDSIEVFSGLGPQAGAAELSDSLSLPDAPLPAPTVEIASAPRGSTDVSYGPLLPAIGGSFSAVVPAPSPEQVLWVRACFAGACSARPL